MRRRKYNKLKCFKIGVILIMVCVSFWAKMDTKEERVRFAQINTSEWNQREVYLEVPQICQYPTLPTGCESVAATMVLQYYGDDIEAESFASSWLTCDSNFYVENGITYGPDPNKVFAGNPFSKSSYGCFAAVIEKAVNDNSSVCQAQMMKGESLKNLCDTYVVAPETQQSGIGHALTLYEPLRVNEYKLKDGSFGYGVSGTPTDAVTIGLFEILDKKPDIMISGINTGFNIADKILKPVLLLA